MQFEEQVRLGLTQLIARDGYVEVERFIDYSVDNLLANAPPWPERHVTEAVLKAAFQHFVHEALDEHEDDDSLILDDVFIKGKGGVRHEYVIKRGDENGAKLAQAHQERSKT
jgi:hypothetical protein